MHYSLYAGLAFAALFSLGAPFVVRRVSPALATWLVTTGSVISAVSLIGGLIGLAMTLVGQDPSVAAAAHWSLPTLRHADPVRPAVAATALAGLAIAAARFGWVGTQRWRAIAAAHRINRALADTGCDLIVLPATSPDAYAVPGRPGRIFVTRGMLALLSRAECDAMLAHERSHLRHRHHWHRTAVLLADSLNPLLRPLPRLQNLLTERWADEDAARVSDRSVVAAALRRAADAKDSAWERPVGALSLTSHPVEERIAAMMADPPRRGRLFVVAAAMGVLALSVYGTMDGLTDEAAFFHAVPSAHSAPVAR
jgi:Peptidase family M48